MGCGGNKNRLPPNGTIVPLTAKVAKPKAEPKRPKVRKQVDYHCTVCGYTGPHERHTCPGPKKIGYVEHRLKQCSRCQYNKDDVCVLYKSIHPDRDAIISVGVEMPIAACPAGIWPRVLYTCEKCQSVTFNESGVSHCRACGHNKPRVCKMPFVIIDKHEPPLEAKSDRLVVTIAAGQKALDLLELSGPQMEKYAAKVGADFHAVTDDLHPEYPLANKFRLKHLTTNYKRTLFLDVDVWVRNHAENLFEFVPYGSVGIHEDEKYKLNPEWFTSQSAKEAKSQQVDQLELKLYNTGVVVFDVDHQDMWTPPLLPTTKSHLTEQIHVEYTLRRGEYPLHPLRIEHNTQWWMKNFKTMEQSAHFIHLAACPHEERIYRFKKYLLDKRRETLV